jgi:hypothetical protein
MRAPVIVFVLMAIVAVPRHAGAYSVLSHEANIDALWDSAIRPLLVKRFPRATRDEVAKARAYAYGGSVVQDLGYYPFGSHFFSNLLHYVRTGDFVATMIAESQELDEYAFALGALAHYASDNVGHPEGVNRAVALMYPKLRARYGDSVTYADSPTTHVLVEFSFDVVQAATGKYVSDSFRSFIGFEVAKPVLERAFRATYALEMKDVFVFDQDLAIATYRHAVSETIPEITRIAWRDKHEDIEKLLPGVAREKFILKMTREQYEKEFGSNYRKPGLLARFLAFLYKLLPKVGPLRKMEFKAPTPEAEALFVESVRDTRARYRASLDALGAGRLTLANTDFDTGKPSALGEYRLADDTYAELLDKLAHRKFAAVPDPLRKHIAAFYAAAPRRPLGKKEQKRLAKIHSQVNALLNTKDTKATKD